MATFSKDIFSIDSYWKAKNDSSGRVRNQVDPYVSFRRFFGIGNLKIVT